MVGETTEARGAQGIPRGVDVNVPGMQNVSLNASLNPRLDAALQNASQDRRRTVVALVSASIISLVIWGLIVALNVH
jgi:hypothetical protein